MTTALTGDLALTATGLTADVVTEANDLALDAGLESAIKVSLFLDRRAALGDPLPGGHTDRRGFWGDQLIGSVPEFHGSRLWLLAREKAEPAVLARAADYAREALQWLIDDRVASDVTVTAAFDRPGWLALVVTVLRPASTPVSYRFAYAWDAQARKVL